MSGVIGLNTEFRKISGTCVILSHSIFSFWWGRWQLRHVLIPIAHHA
jgi:hypothetical protein